jgi:hypothetical protein
MRNIRISLDGLESYKMKEMIEANEIEMEYDIEMNCLCMRE